MNFALTPESLLSIAGVILSLLFSYLPGLATWYNGIPSDLKRGVMLGVLFVTTAGIYGLACAGIITGIECSQPSAIRFVQAFFAALILNQATDRISPRIGAKG